MDDATSKYVLGVARAPGSGQFPTTDQLAMRIPSECLTIEELSDFALRPILLTSPVLDAPPQEQNNPA